VFKRLIGILFARHHQNKTPSAIEVHSLDEVNKRFMALHKNDMLANAIYLFNHLPLLETTQVNTLYSIIATGYVIHLASEESLVDADKMRELGSVLAFYSKHDSLLLAKKVRSAYNRAIEAHSFAIFQHLAHTDDGLETNSAARFYLLKKRKGDHLFAYSQLNDLLQKFKNQLKSIANPDENSDTTSLNASPQVQAIFECKRTLEEQEIVQNGEFRSLPRWKIEQKQVT
jgi:hypothetical protein